MEWTVDRLTQLASGYWPAGTLIAGVQLGVFDALSNDSFSSGTLASRLDLDAFRLTSVLDALVAIDLLEKSAERYSIARTLRPWLVRGSPTCMLDALAYNADLFRQWADLAAVVRGGVDAGGPPQLGGDPERTRRFVLGMDAKARAYTPAIEAVIDLNGVQRLLDVGAGPGTLSRRLASRSADLKVTLLDLPPVLAVAQTICAASDIADRLSFHAADYRAEPLPCGFDAVLYAGALHQESVASAEALFCSVRSALSPGGRIFVVDLMLDDGRTSPAFSALFQLNMMLLSPTARVFSVGEVVALLDAAGFVDTRVTSAAGTPYRVVSGRAGDVAAKSA